MPYLSIQDFKIGMDRRRKRIAGTPGSLWTLENAHITRGGDIERAKKMVPYYDLPAGTFGAAQVKGQIFVFGSADLSSSIPAGVQYQRLQKGSANMVRVLDVKVAQAKFYVVAEFDDGGLYHFYDGTRITGWDTIADTNASYENLASYLADKINNESNVEAVSYGTSITLTARTAGTAFTIAKSTTDIGGTTDQDIVLTEVQANVVAQAAASATGTVEITTSFGDPSSIIAALTVEGTNLLADPVVWETSNVFTASLLAAEINAGTESHTYSASADGTVVTILAGAGTGEDENGKVVATVNQGAMTTTTTNMAGGAAAVDAAAQIYRAEFTGTMEEEDIFTLTIDGTAYSGTPRAAATGTAAFVSNRRVFSPAADVLFYTQIDDFDDYSDGTASSGAGFIPLSSNAENMERAVTVGSYNNRAAVFGREAVSLYLLDTDSDNIIFDLPIENSGTPAARSVIGYGNNDLFYLDTSGIRSLRARQGTEAPYVSDVGSPMDPFLIDHMASIPKAKVARAVAAIEPTDGRLMVAVDRNVYVFSYFPSNKISAWSYYDFGFVITDFVRARGRLYARAGDVIYLYGGEDNDSWPDEGEQIVTLETPFLSANTPATDKMFAGVDMGIENTWSTFLLPDPANDALEIDCGTFTKTTYGKPDINVPGETSLFALRMECRAAGRASISSMAIHYSPESNPS